MITTLSPGRRAQAAQLGINPNLIGRVLNRATLTPPEGVPIPSSPEELADMIADDSRVAAIMADRSSWGGFMQAYADKAKAKDPDLDRQIEAGAQKVLAEMLKTAEVDSSEADAIKRMNLSPLTRGTGMLTAHKQATAYNAKAPGAILDKEFATAGEFIHATWHLNDDEAAQQKMRQLRNAYSSVVPADGGFLVPETLRSQLLQIALEMAVVRPRATVVPMETARVPFPAIDSSTNAGSVFGGMIAYWGEESAALTESQAKFNRVVLDAKKLTGLSVVPNELLQDSLISFEALISTLWPKALAWYEDAAFMSGTGVGEPLGFLGGDNPASIGITKEAGQGAATILLENVIKMYSRMLPSSLSQGIWVCSPEALPELFTMALSVGTGGGPVMLTNVTGPAPITIFGRPLVVSEKAGRLGTRSDLAFVDLSYYLVGDRQIMSASSSTDWKFGNDQTAYRIIQRVDGTPWLKNPITPKNGGPTLSPFVEIADRA